LKRRIKIWTRDTPLLFSKANVAEHGESFATRKKVSSKQSGHSGKGQKLGPKGGIAKKQKAKFQGRCNNYDKVGYRSVDCCQPKRNPERAHVIEDLSRDEIDINLSAMVSEVNLVGSNPREWWIDTGATHHICSDRRMFTSFKAAANGEKLYMDTSATFSIPGQGKVVMKITLGRELTLNKVPYVPDICKNLVSGSLLSMYGFRIVFESNKVVGAHQSWDLCGEWLCNLTDGLLSSM
jgi:hypothetical protein